MVLITAVVIALWWMATGGLTGPDLVTARLDALKVGLSLGVGTGGLFALYLTWRRQRAAEAELDNRERALVHQLHTAADANKDATERRVTELYTRAVDQLGADKAPVRLGGLYALERLAQDNVEHRQTVVNVLCAYLYRRGLLDAVLSDHLIGYGVNMSVTATKIADVARTMAERLPGPDVTPEQLRNRSWWQGPDLYLLVDDYDLVAGGSSNPLTALIDYLPQDRDIGLHVILARRTGGASRAMFDPIIQRLREAGAPGLIMSGDRDEGPLVGTIRPSAQPPGRGWLVDRQGNKSLIQLAWLPPND